MITDMFQVEVLVHGRPVHEYPHRGAVFIEGRIGSEFTLRVRNNASRRVLAVVSVDGLSVMSGKTASRSDAGYVVEPYRYVDIPGWRLDNVEVAHFFFGRLPEAYAAKMGKPENIGVIGAVFFHEVLPSYEVHRGRDLLGGGESLTLGGGVGTGFGRRTRHEVSCVDFDRKPTPAAEFIIRYDDAEGLRRLGIVVAGAHDMGDRVVTAKPFPADPIGCQPPCGWSG